MSSPYRFLNALASSVTEGAYWYKGMGFKENGEIWIEHQNEFNLLLSELTNNNNNVKGITSEKNEIKSLEEKSKQSKARLHYQKFTRGKDLSKYSENDLDCILGTKKLKKEKNLNCMEKEVVTENGFEKSFGVTTINSGSIQDYFKKEWVFGKLKKKNSIETIDNSDKIIFKGSDSDNNNIDLEVKEKKTKKRKFEIETNLEEELNNEVEEHKERKKKKKKKDYNKINDESEDKFKNKNKVEKQETVQDEKFQPEIFNDNSSNNNMEESNEIETFYTKDETQKEKLKKKRKKEKTKEKITEKNKNFVPTKEFEGFEKNKKKRKRENLLEEPFLKNNDENNAESLKENYINEAIIENEKTKNLDLIINMNAQDIFSGKVESIKRKKKKKKLEKKELEKSKLENKEITEILKSKKKCKKDKHKDNEKEESEGNLEIKLVERYSDSGNCGISEKSSELNENSEKLYQYSKIKKETQKFETNENVIYSHKAELFKKKSCEILRNGYCNAKVIKLISGADFEEFKGSNLINLSGYGIEREIKKKL